MRLLLILFSLVLLVMSGNVCAQDTDHPAGVYSFVENGGQWPDHVLYRANVGSGNIWLEKGGILYQFNDYSDVEDVHVGHESNKVPELKQHLVFAEFVGVTGSVETSHKYPSDEYYNYFMGSDESKWASNLHGYNHITYHDLYPDIDMLILEKDNDLKYEFHVAPNGDPNQIAIKYLGQDNIKLKSDGNVQIKTSLGELIEQKPYVYQVKNGRIIEIEAEFKLDDNILSYRLENYDESLELIIDPVLIFATYSGSITDNFGMTATYAYDGRGYSGGIVYGNAYPTPAAAWNTTSTFTGTSSAAYGITDVFISKYEADGSTMIFTTFIGGGNNIDGTETVHSLICDTSNNIYLYGATSSTDFPMVNAYQNTHAGGTSGSNYYYNGVYYQNQGTDIYVSKFSEDGMNLLGSTYVGGSANDGVNYRIAGGTYNSVGSYDSLTSNYGDQFRGEIMLDSMNNVYIASSTRSSDFPVLNSFQGTLGGQQDGVVFMLSSDFSNLVWSSYYGGTENDACYSVKIDSSSNVLIAGGTSSNDIPGTLGGLNPVALGGKADGYIAKISPDGSILSQATYIGTPNDDQNIFVEIDRWDNVYVVGVTNGAMPIFNAVYSNPNSGQYIQKLSPDLTSLIYGTVFGNGSGSPNISPSAFLVDVCGNVYVSGWGANILQPTPLSGMPISTDAFQSTPPNGFDFYLFVMERDAESLLYGSYLGGSSAQEHVDGGTSRFDKYGIVYQSVCGGCGGYSDFPTTTGAWSNNNLSTNCNNILFKFDFELLPIADFTTTQFEGCAPLTLVFDNESNDTVNFSWSFPPEATVQSGGVNPQVLFPEPGNYVVTLTVLDTICNLLDTAQKIITVYEQTQLSVPNDTLLCTSTTFDLTANSFGTANSFTWAEDISFTTPLNSGAMDSTISISPTVSTTYYVMVSSGWPLCDLVDSVQVLFVDGAIQVMDDTSICVTDTAFLHAENLVPSVPVAWDWAPNEFLLTETGNIATTSPPSSMWFYLTATTTIGCVYTDSVWVNVSAIDPATVLATATPDSVAIGGVTTLEVFPSGYLYLWQPIGVVDNQFGQTTTATIEQDTYFEVTIYDGTCEYKTNVTVYALEFICGDVYIYVPNAFSPNGDGMNEMVYVRGQNLLEIDFKIFDRWGELVFETQDQSIGWDGIFNGKVVDPDVYVYHLKVKCVDGQENLMKGNITVLR